jgi:transposase
VEVPIGHLAEYERLSRDGRFVRMRQTGCTPHAIARALNRPYLLVCDAVAYAEAGVRATTRSPGTRRPKGTPKRDLKYVTHAKAVADLKDGKGLSFQAIAKQCGISLATAGHAYHYFHRERAASAADAGKAPPRAKYSIIGAAKVREVHRLRAQGNGAEQIASTIGCGLSTVYRMLSKPVVILEVLALA